MLQAAGIKCSVERADRIGIAPLLGAGSGGRVLVPSAQESQARELVVAAEAGIPGIGSRGRSSEADRPHLSAEEVSGALRRIQGRRLYMWGLYLGFLPVCGVFFLISGSGIGTLVLAAIWACLFSLVANWVASSRCPACGQQCYRMRWWASNIFLGKCYHCGLLLRPPRVTG